MERDDVGGSANRSDPDHATLDPAEVARLYLEHAEPLKRFLAGVLRDPQLAHDVLQATFAKLVESGGGTQSDKRKAWLFKVAYNEALAIRRRQSTGDRVVRRAAWQLPHSSQPADEPLIRVETVEAVRKAMEQLPAEQQVVLRMRVYEELTFAEIARQLDIPLGTALARMRSALTKLRTFLNEDVG